MDNTETTPIVKKPWYKSKIIIIAIIQAIVGVLVIFMSQYPTIGAIAVAKSIVDIVVRLITDLPIE